METPSINSEIIDAMRDGVDYRQKITCRRFNLTVRPLSIGETIEIAAKVQERLDELNKYKSNRLSEHTILAAETLERASTSYEGQNDYKLTSAEVLKMTPEEIDFLWKQYIAMTDKVNPSLELIPPDTMGAVVEALKKSPSPAELALALTRLSFLELASLARFLLEIKGDSQPVS